MSTTEDKFSAFLEGLEMQKIDELLGLQPESLRQVAETMAGAIKENIVRAYIAGAKRMYLGGLLSDLHWTENYQKTAEALAERYMVDRELGKKGE